jgi:hypothetical protein
MPNIVATCDYCGTDYDCTAREINDLFSRCTECASDVCKSCGDIEDKIHKSCKETRDYEKEEA